MKKIILSILFLCFFSNLAFAEAYFAGKKEMVEKAEGIAIVNITNTEETEKKGNHWTYRQKATGTIEKYLKGNLEAQIEIYGMENFICAQCHFEKGRFLLFLSKDGDFWRGSNWHLSIHPIKDGKVEWFKDEASFFEMEQKPLEDVLLEIQSILKEKKE